MANSSNAGREAKDAIIANLPQLIKAVSINDAVFRAIVLSSVKHRLIIQSFSIEILEMDKTPLADRATRFISSISAVVDFNHNHLDTFLLILHDEGGITGIEMANAIAMNYGRDLPQYEAASTDKPSTQHYNNQSMDDSTSTACSSTDQLNVNVDGHHSTLSQVTNDETVYPTDGVDESAEANAVISIDDLLNPPYNISMECLRIKIKNDHLVLFALGSTTVEDVARYFDMEKYIDQSQRKNTTNGQIVSILSMWKQIKGNDATYLAIIEIFIQNGRHEVAKSIACNLKRKYMMTSSQSTVDKYPFKPELSYPNWNELDEKEKESIKNSLRKENNEVIDVFRETYFNVYTSIRDRNVDPEELQLYLSVGFSKTDVSMLRQMDTVVRIFHFILDKKCNWFNYHLLNLLTNRFGSDKDKHQMNDYVKILWAYLERSLYRIPPESFGSSQRQPDKAFCFFLPVADGNDISGQQLTLIHNKLAEKLGISPCHIHVEVIPGSIIIHFIMNKELFMHDDDRLAGFTKHKTNDNVYYIDEDWLKYFPDNNETLPKELCLCGYIDDPFSCLLKKFGEKLSLITLPSEIVHLLYTEDVIDKETFDKVESSEGHLVNESFIALCSAVYLNHNRLRVFASVLLQFEDTVLIAKDIFQESLVSGLVSPILKWTFPGKDSVSNLPFLIKSTDGDDSLSSDLHDEFISFINSVMPLIADGLSSLDGLKSFLGRAYAEMRPQLAHAWSITDALILVIENCSLINVSCLEAVIYHSSIEPAQDLLSDYIDKVNEYCSNTTCSHCEGVSFRISSSHLLICDTIQFTLHPNEIADDTLNDVRLLIENLFGHLAKKVHIASIMIKEASMIAVSCYIPHYITNSLLSEIHMNKNLMTARIQIFSINGSILWDYSTPTIDIDIKSMEGDEGMSQSDEAYSSAGPSHVFTGYQQTTEQLKQKLLKQTNDNNGLKESLRLTICDLLRCQDDNFNLKAKNEQQKNVIDKLDAQVLELKKIKQKMTFEIEDLKAKENVTKTDRATQYMYLTSAEEHDSMSTHAVSPGYSKGYSDSRDHPVFTDKPTVLELKKVLSELKEWRRFGAHLPGITKGMIHTLGRYGDQSIGSRKDALFAKWLRVYEKASWNDVITALFISGEFKLLSSVASDIKRSYTRQQGPHTTEITESPQVKNDKQHTIMTDDVPNDDELKRDAKRAIKKNLDKLIDVISSSESTLQDIVLGCAAKELIPTSFKNRLLDPLTGISIQARTAELLSFINNFVSFNPMYLDVFLTVLTVKCDKAGREVARDVAKEYGHKLPQYEASKPVSEAKKRAEYRKLSESQYVQDIKSLIQTFQSIITNIKLNLRESQLHEIVRFVEEKLRFDGNIQVTTIDELFDKIQPHYSFLDCELIEEIVDEFLSANIEIQDELSQYMYELNILKKLMPVRDIDTKEVKKTSQTPCSISY